MNKIRGFKIRLRKREILRTLKYDSRYTVLDPGTENLIQSTIERAYELICPCAVYKTFAVATEDFSVVKDDITLGSIRVQKMLRKAPAFSLMAVTIGDELESEVDRIKKDNMTEAYILDAAGSEAAEQSVNFVSKMLTEEAIKSECHLSDRYSPGYGDWPLEASKRILKYLDKEKIDIHLSDSGIMRPRKSITALQVWITG
ncbi:MAG: hypothetical protein ABIH89_02070 [Elusimicrobiota bacterium]